MVKSDITMPLPSIGPTILPKERPTTAPKTELTPIPTLELIQKPETDLVSELTDNRLGLNENDEHEGSQVNAYRHALWQSMITNKYGTSIAKEVEDAHEEHPDALSGISDYNKVLYTNLSLADEASDLLNNKIVKAIGNQYDESTSSKTLALATLEYYHDYGLWVAIESQDGFYTIEQQKLIDEEYETAYNRLIT